jgi:hypothetical protein
MVKILLHLNASVPLRPNSSSASPGVVLGVRRSREAAGKSGRRRLRSRCRCGARGRRWVARKGSYLCVPGVVHDGGVPHGNIDDPVVRARVLRRPKGKALLPRGRCEPHDLSKDVILLTKLVTHVIMKSHMNEICLQYHNLPLWRVSCLGALGTWCPAGSCRGPGPVAMAGYQARTSPAPASSGGTTEGTLPKPRRREGGAR